ncbi:hypothetical protein EDD29_5908 [Actinocorallia herbida]|uniref:Uncharacterized protein n=1 Tax=Actinocorallia herbida TaxID=58109 RepID=A0A3N1D3Z7_9ACTN|nr:hypothetical protein [Actinocorallia herbida]ROO88245.1 hypothetical protein EDD29_5908 [Actinocorallia herbida]
MGKPKRRVSTPPLQAKEVPRPGSLPGAETSTQRICWRFTHVDHDGPWGFDRLDGTTLAWMFGQLRSFESMRIDELFSQGGHPGKHYETERLPNETALKRLDDLRLADMTRISRLRLSGAGRLYGFLVDQVFHVVWWDPRHEIWPSPKKHT